MPYWFIKNRPSHHLQRLGWSEEPPGARRGGWTMGRALGCGDLPQLRLWSCTGGAGRGGTHGHGGTDLTGTGGGTSQALLLQLRRFWHGFCSLGRGSSSGTLQNSLGLFGVPWTELHAVPEELLIALQAVGLAEGEMTAWRSLSDCSGNQEQGPGCWCSLLMFAAFPFP